MRRCRNKSGFIAAAFGIGLLLAICIPAKALVVVLAAVVIALGAFLCNR